ncbi:MAG: 2-phospho-L-lactate transferase [Actinobacteria bacterium]|nr:2-phospho-L-lactate transferase [Actinomycetota bacterium]
MHLSNSPDPKLTVLAGGVGGARFVLALRAARPEARITVIGNIADDIWLFGLKVCPDLDTLMYTIGGGADAERGWGRADETFHAAAELAAYGAQPDWFGLGDRDLATHLIRTQMLSAGYPLSQVTAALCARWELGVELLPASDDRVETHVVVEEGGRKRAIHFQEWWVRHRAALPASDFVMVGAESASPGPGVVAAIESADAVLLPPSNPVVSIGAIMAIEGIRDAIRTTRAPVVGMSGIVSGRPLRGMADACLNAIGVDVTAAAVAAHYGARPDGILDGWLVDEQDADQVPAIEAAGLLARAAATVMSDPASSVTAAEALLGLADEVARRG